MTQKSTFQLPTGPDYVVLYQKNIEAISSSEAEIRDQIRRTVIHEFGHYFGMNEEQSEGRLGLPLADASRMPSPVKRSPVITGSAVLARHSEVKGFSLGYPPGLKPRSFRGPCFTGLKPVPFHQSMSSHHDQQPRMTTGYCQLPTDNCLTALRSCGSPPCSRSCRRRGRGFPAGSRRTWGCARCRSRAHAG